MQKLRQGMGEARQLRGRPLPAEGCQKHQDICAGPGRARCGLALEPDAVVAWDDPIGERYLVRNLASKLRDVNAKVLGKVKAGIDVPDIGDRVEPAGLDGNGLQHVALEVRRQRIAELPGDQALDRLQALCRRRGGDDVVLYQNSSSGACIGRFVVG